MPNGIDTAMVCTAQVDHLAAQGFTFVGRYYNINNRAKNLTVSEAKALSRAGLSIVTVWENGYPTTPECFSHSKGVHNGTAAYHMAMHDIGQPSDTPIYFAVDFDASETDIQGAISDYFRGIREAFAIFGEGDPHYNVGVYGSGTTCEWLFGHGFVTFAWLSQSTGWSGHKIFTRWNIKQGPVKAVCGLDVDLDESQGDGGGWRLV